ncbi:oligosaccharide flippase family protein [bacterium]|nr:oligosaccharide flippase family protein [bacterium]MDB4632965.1 oligosaccharide flippase family protein [bacterium]
MRFKIPQGAEALTVAMVAGQIIGLLRTQLVARQLGTEVQGEAVTIGLITGFFSTVLVLNTAWQLVQSKHGDEPEFKSSLQGVAIVRGLITSVVVLIAGWYTLGFFDLERLRGPLCLVAWMPLLEGALSLDAWERLRTKSFRALVIVEISGAVGGLVAALISLVFIQSVWVVVIATVGASASRLIASHLVRQDPWQLAVHRRFIRSIIRFSLPLIPAGMFFWINNVSDRILLLLSERVDWLPVSSLSELGSYGTVAGMIMLPFGLVAKVTRSVVVPRMAQSSDDPVAWDRIFRRFGTRMMALSLLVVTAAGIAGDAPFRVILGDAFIAGAVVSPILAIAFGLQVLRMFGYQAGVAIGDTKPQLIGNFARLSGIVVGFVLLRRGYGLEGLAYSLVVGELIALSSLALWLEAFRIARGRWILVWMIGVVATSLLMQSLGDAMLGDFGPWPRFGISIAVMVGPSFFVLRMLRREENAV